MINSSSRIGIWDQYQMMANPIVIEDGEDWVDLTLEELVKIVKQEIEKN